MANKKSKETKHEQPTQSQDVEKGHKKPHILYKITYPIGLILSKIPTVTYGIKELNPMKQMWAVKYNQNPPNIVWFFRYPNHMRVEHIGKNSWSGNAIVMTYYLRCWIGDNVIISNDTKILYKPVSNNVPAFNDQKAPLVRLGNNIYIGWGASLMVGKEGLSICDNVVIGAGSIVTKDITKSGVYAGVPAKRIK